MLLVLPGIRSHNSRHKLYKSHTFRTPHGPINHHVGNPLLPGLSVLNRWMTRYFFSSPFRHQHLPSEAGVSFDVTLCPLADYFKDQGVPELTQHAACNLDYCAAREYGVDLVRTQTIADGAAHCDFRWKFPVYEERSQKAGQS